MTSASACLEKPRRCEVMLLPITQPLAVGKTVGAKAFQQHVPAERDLPARSCSRSPANDGNSCCPPRGIRRRSHLYKRERAGRWGCRIWRRCGGSRTASIPVQDVMHVVERFAALGKSTGAETIAPEVLHHAKARSDATGTRRCFPAR